MDQAYASRLGRSRRHHRGSARAEWFQGSEPSLRGTLRLLRHSHSASRRADPASELHSQIRPADIASVEALLPRDTMPIVAEPAAAKTRPDNEYEAKFSAQFVVATCLLKGAFGLADLMPAALADRAVLDLTRRVTCAIDPNSAFPTYFSGGVRIVLKDGRTLFRHTRVNSGAGERALDEAGVSKKFLASAALSIPLSQAQCIRDAILTLESHTAAEITALLRFAPTSSRSERSS